jgi:5'-nucleotidase / UDP-sugar diphosphatase
VNGPGGRKVQRRPAGAAQEAPATPALLATPAILSAALLAAALLAAALLAAANFPGASLLPGSTLSSGAAREALLPNATRDGAPAQVAQAAAHAGGELRVTIVHTSDEHSAVLPGPLVDHHGGPGDPTRGGFARLARAVGALRERASLTGEPMLLTSAGDNIGGTPFAWLSLQGAAVELGLMVEAGYDVVTLGNHEFDYDSDRLARYIAAAGYPAAAQRTAIVAANTRPPPGHPLAAVGIERTRILELPNGLRVGFLGLIGRGAARFATLAPPVEFTDARSEAAAAVAELREAGAHIVIALTHSGVEEDRELARAVPGIDVILGGHDHVLLEQPELEAGTLIVHPGAYLRELFILELGYDAAAGSVRVRNPETGTPFVLPLDAAVGESDWMTARVAEHRARLEAHIAELRGGGESDLAATVARSAFALRRQPPMEETGLGNFVADAMRAAAAAATGSAVDFAFQANGVIRGDIATGSVPGRVGDISLHDLVSVVSMGASPAGRPGYPLVAVWLTGEEVRRVLEISVLLSELLRDSYYLQVSGLRMRYDPGRAILLRVPVRGTPIPTGRAVLRAERATADGFLDLERGDGRLYHVVTDYYVASFLPMVGRMLPRLGLVPKDSSGAAIADIDDAILRRDGVELTTWQAVLEYAAAQPVGTDGVPRIDGSYAGPEGRLVRQSGVPLPLLLAGAGVVLLGLPALALYAWRARRRARGRGAAAVDAGVLPE